MNFDMVLSNIIRLFQNNIYISIPAAILMLYLLLRRPKLFFSIVVIGLILAAILYFISDLSTTGLSYKKQMIGKTP